MLTARATNIAANIDAVNPPTTTTTTIIHYSTYTYINVEIASINQSIHQQRDRYRLRVTAADRGTPPSAADVDVELDVVDRNNKPPIWDKSIYGPIHIRENVTVGTIVTSVKARFV